MLESQNRVIMISGANRGIGFETAKLLQAKGYFLSLGARKIEEIELKDNSKNLIKCSWDAKDKSSSKKWVDSTLASFGRIDGVVMNAGVELGGDLDGDTEDEFDEMFEVNFKGPLRLVRETMPELRKSGSGRVVKIADAAAPWMSSRQQKLP